MGAIMKSQRGHHYLFGYGSLINAVSRKASGVTGRAHPVRVSSFVRGWNIQSLADRYTGVGVQPIADGLVNGVVAQVAPTELYKFDLRELVHGYAKLRISTERIRSLTAWKLPSNSNIWAYVVTQPTMATRDFPISQYYLDVCMLGCLDFGRGFAEEFVRTTFGWNYPWLNDRTHPRRRGARVIANRTEVKKLQIIDSILAAHQPMDFSQREGG